MSLRPIINGTNGRVSAHLRADTARRLLAVSADQSTLSPNRKVDGTGTRRRLQALVALGWPPSWLAQQLNGDRANLRRILHAGGVTARTARDVAALYENLWNIRPDAQTPRDEGAIADALTLAAKREWLAPLAWDNMDHDHDAPSSPVTVVNDVDDIAVELATGGTRIALRQLLPSEQAEVVGRLSRQGKSVRDIADQLSTSPRTISRLRCKINIAPALLADP